MVDAMSERPAHPDLHEDGNRIRSSCDVVVSIINYRTGPLTISAARSVLESCGDLDAHVVIVDNRSDDGSAEEIAAWIDSLPAPAPVTLVRSETNSGFSGGHNKGMAVRPAVAYLLLNSDALLRPGALQSLCAALDANPQIGVVAPRLEYDDGAPQISAFRFPSPLSELIRGAQTGPITTLLKRWDMPLGVEPDPAAIGWVSFACVLLRGEMTATLGPMDEGFFLYSEDVEYCWRAQQAGWRVVYEPKARAVHVRGGSGPAKTLDAARARLPGYVYASRTRLFHLMYGRWGLLAANLLWTIGAGALALRHVVGRPQGRTAAREALDVWINFLDPLGDSRRPADSETR